MLQWLKLGRVLDPAILADRGLSFAQSPATVDFGSHLRVYFCSRTVAPGTGLATSQIYFADFDRQDPSRMLSACPEPVVGLGGTGCFDEFGMNPVSAVRHGDEVRLYYAGWTRCVSVPFNAAIGVVVSDDGGRTFRRLGPGPVLSYCPDEPFVIGSPRVKIFEGRWHLWYASGRRWVTAGERPEPVYTIRQAVSDDGLEWERLGRDVLPSVLEQDECQAAAEVFPARGGGYHMLFSYRHNLDFQQAGRGYRIGYAFSQDLRSWRRDDAQANLPASQSGWDSEMVSYTNVFSLEGRAWAYYQGNGVGRTGFGLARLDDGPRE